MDIRQQLCGKGENQASMNMEERGPLIGEEGAAPRGVRQPKEKFSSLFISLFMVLTPSST
jgi:hypothetical protein